MPRVKWGIDAADVDDFDRDSQYTPYNGPIPANGVYEWTIKVLKSVAGTRDKLPQLRVGLELTPRPGRDEKKFKGYFIMAFIPVSDKTQFRYVPFLDAIGVTGREFTTNTLTDEDGNVRRIGKWRNTGDVIIAAELKDGTDQDGKSRKEIGWMGAPGDDGDDDDDDGDYDGYDDDVDLGEGDDDDWEDE